MDRSYPSYADPNYTTSSNSITATSRDYHLRQLSKLSHKISKPITNKNPIFDSSQNPLQNHNFNQPRPQLQPQLQPQPQQQQQNLQNQPPVYNISKNDFRDLVQKLTGSPAQERICTLPPIQQPRPPSTRLQRIRPPPLAQISNRPPPLMNRAIHPQPQPPAIGGATAVPSNPFNPLNPVSVNNFSGFGRPGAPSSPLPPFPTVHAPAESPVSAYMRYLQDSISAVDSNSKQFASCSPLAPLVSRSWNNFTPQKPQQEQQSQPQPQQQQLPTTQQPMLQPQSSAVAQQQLPMTQQAMLQQQSSSLAQPQTQFQTPSSPIPFGCLNSPLSNYPLLSPSLLFSPSSGQLGFPQLPLSPTVPVPSPRWRGL